MSDARTGRGEQPRVAGLLVAVAGLAVTAAGVAVFAGKAKDPAALGTPTAWALLGLLVGLALVEAGSWMNAAFYRALERAPYRSWLEVGGGVALVAGLLALGNGLAYYWMGTSAEGVPAIVTGLVLLELALMAEHRTLIRVCTGPAFPLTMIVAGAALLGVLALALVSYLNVRHFRRADLTRAGFYSLSSQTVEVLKNVRKPLRIIATMARNPNPQSEEQDYENFARARAGELLEEYQKQSRHVEYIPLDYRHPDAIDRLEKELKVEFRADNVVFAYGSGRDAKAKVVEFTEILTPPNPFFRQPRQFKAEEAFTGALQVLLEERGTRVYFTKGHGEKSTDDYEPSGLSAIVERVRGDNAEVKTCALPEIPDDCDVLVVAGPKAPFRPDEVDAVRKYLAERPPDRPDAGLIVMLDPVLGEAQPTGLEALLQDNGIEARTMDAIVEIGRIEMGPLVGRGPTVAIEATDYGAQQMAWGGAPPQHAIVRDLKTLGTTFYLACPLASTAPPRPNPMGGPPQGDPFTAELVKTSPQAFAKADLDPASLGRLRIDRDQDKPGPFTLAIARGLSKGQQPPMQPMGPPPPQGKLVVFGDSDFITNQRASLGNATLFRNAVSWAAGKEYKAGIPPKPLAEDNRLELPGDERLFAWWATVFAPPFHVLVIGLIIWWIRRR